MRLTYLYICKLCKTYLLVMYCVYSALDVKYCQINIQMHIILLVRVQYTNSLQIDF